MVTHSWIVVMLTIISKHEKDDGVFSVDMGLWAMLVH